jgi:hypothetical protein
MSDDLAQSVATPGVPPPLRPKIQIVPLKGLPVAIAVLLFVVVAVFENWKWGLTFCHVVGGGLWTGIDLFVGLVIGPILGRLSIPARAEFSARFMPKMVLIMPTVGLESESLVAHCIVLRGRRHGGHRARHPRARQYCRAIRNE